MAKINLMELQPTRLCKDLRGRFVEIFGREKAGKTSTAVLWPKPLLCAFEVGYHALANVYAADIDTWSTFKDICRQLRKPEMKEKFETIIIDTVGIAYSMCEDYIKQQQGVTEISEIAWGRGFKMLREEFEKTFRDLSKQGYAIVFIAHSKTKVTDVTDSEGNKLEQISPNLPPACAEAVNGLVDIIAYLGVEYDEQRNATRWLYLRETPTIFAGSRYRAITPKIPLSYEGLVKAVADAMEEEARITGTGFISEEEMNKANDKPEATFQEVMEEARKNWAGYLDGATTDEEKDIRLNTMQAIISKIFGSNSFKLSQAIPQQKSLVELFNAEMEDLKN